MWGCRCRGGGGGWGVGSWGWWVWVLEMWGCRCRGCRIKSFVLSLTDQSNRSNYCITPLEKTCYHKNIPLDNFYTSLDRFRLDNSPMGSELDHSSSRCSNDLLLCNKDDELIRCVQ